MKQTKQLSAIIEREEDGYVSLCPELDIASQVPAGLAQCVADLRMNKQGVRLWEAYDLTGDRSNSKCW